MALDDKDIFQAICARYADQPFEFIMAQYEKAKLMNMEIERRTSTMCMPESSPEPEQEEMPEVVEVAEVVEQPARKKYTRRQLRVKPQDAITEDVIYCCICGEERQSLTAKHLAQHGITVEDYKKLCGYPANQPLMSGRRLARSKEVIARAQQARMDKKAAEAEH